MGLGLGLGPLGIVGLLGNLGGGIVSYLENKQQREAANAYNEKAKQEALNFIGMQRNLHPYTGAGGILDQVLYGYGAGQSPAVSRQPIPIPSNVVSDIGPTKSDIDRRSKSVPPSATGTTFPGTSGTGAPGSRFTTDAAENLLLPDFLRGGLSGRAKSITDYFEKGKTDILAKYGKRESDILDFLDTGTAGLAKDYSNTTANLLAGYGDRERRVMGLLEGLGEQDKKDLAQRYDELSNQTRQDLVGYGLTGTTVAPSMEAGVRREESDAANRLADFLHREQAGYLKDLTGEALTSQENMDIARLASAENMLKFGTGMKFDLTGQELSAQEALLGAGVGLQGQLSADFFDALQKGLYAGQERQDFWAAMTPEVIMSILQQPPEAINLGDIISNFGNTAMSLKAYQDSQRQQSNSTDWLGFGIDTGAAALTTAAAFL